jgi:hypothetical protein
MPGSVWTSSHEDNGEPKMDEQKRQSLVDILEPFIDDQDCYTPTPAVPLEQFFEGNDDEGSIGCNLTPHPGIDTFYQTLAKLRDGGAVSGIWILAKQHDWKPGWPFSDEVLIRTTLDKNGIASHLQHLRPDTVEAVTPDDLEKDIFEFPVACGPGERHIIAWWD